MEGFSLRLRELRKQRGLTRWRRSTPGWGDPCFRSLRERADDDAALLP